MTKSGNDREKKAARALAAEEGINYTTALRRLRREKAQSALPAVSMADRVDYYDPEEPGETYADHPAARDTED